MLQASDPLYADLLRYAPLTMKLAIHNYAQKKTAHHVCTHITSKRIEQEGPGWSGLVWF